MIIYAETKQQFLDDVDRNLLHRRLTEGFRRQTGGVPADERVWADEYSRFSHSLRRADVDDRIQVAIEYHISAAGRFRVDVLLAGNDGTNDNGLILELKAWDRADVSAIPDLVWVPFGGGSNVQHPCVQARKYKGLILRFNADIRDRCIGMHSAAYLFNLWRRTPEPLEDPRYQHIIDDSHLFLADDADALCRYMEKHVRHKPQQDVLFLLEKGRLIPAPALIERVGSMLSGNEEFELLDAQNEAFQIIRHAIAGAATASQRQVFIVHGGPGTGKSVIAVRLLAEVLGSKRLGFFVAPNKAFRDTLVEQLSGGDKGYREDGQALFQSSWSFHQSDFMKDRTHEVLIVDEAHRLKDKAYQYKGKSMVEDMVRAARISVFFLDETQRVSWLDTGSDARIRAAAKKYKAHVHSPFTLAAQFRCGGSDGYLNWLDDVLQVRPTGNYDHWADGGYAFEVFDDAEAMYVALQKKNGDNKARLLAGYSWEWPTTGRLRAKHVQHVQADGLALPWNFMGETWAMSPDGIGQVGCVHTCQGVEFDWLGVLIGPDLRVEAGKVIGEATKRATTDTSLKGWKKELKDAGSDQSARERVLQKVQSIIKNTYKVLLSRGRKGCYVWCADAGLRDYLRERLRLASRTFSSDAMRAEDLVTVPVTPRETQPTASTKTIPKSFVAPRVSPEGSPEVLFNIVPSPPGKHFNKWLPVYDLRAAAGAFGPPSAADCLGWVHVPAGVRCDERSFVAQVFGRSMEPRICDGSYCVFRFDVTGSRSGRILLVQHAELSDPETGGSYTVKKYVSTKVSDVRRQASPTESADGAAWEHATISLLPLNPDFSPIPIAAEIAMDLRVIAEFVTILHSS